MRKMTDSEIWLAALVVGITLIILVLTTGCATSPVAWRDLGDGEGVRGWAGIPLKYSVPVALAAQAAARPQREWHNIDTMPQQPYQPLYSPVFNPVPIGR